LKGSAKYTKIFKYTFNLIIKLNDKSYIYMLVILINNYQLDSDLSSGLRYTVIEQLGPVSKFVNL